MSDRKPKVALVSGGSRGIGAAIGIRLARDGFDVAITYKSSEDLAARVVERIESLGRRAIAIQADIEDAGFGALTVGRTVDRLGSLAVLVNNAAQMERADTAARESEVLDRLYCANVRSVYVASCEAAAAMSAGGRIVNVGSVLAERVDVPGMAAYAMSKSAVAGLTRSLAREFGERGITVNVIDPGPIATDMNPPDSPWAERTLQALIVKRYGQPGDIAGAVSFLVSPDADFITGACLRVDGGLLC